MVFLLVIAVLTTAPAAFSMTVPHQPPAGCHEHARQAPGPEPVSYQCCQTGHNAAVPQTVTNIRPLVLIPRSPAPEEVLFSVTGHGGFHHSLISSSSPPGSTPLRV